MIFVIKSDVAPLFQEPSTASQRTDEVLHGMAVSLVAEKGNWLYIKTAYRYYGWLQREHVTAYNYNDSIPYYVNAPTADILTDPKVQGELLICLPMGSIVHKIAPVTNCNRLDWTAVKLADGRSGYIRSAFLASFAISISRDAIVDAAKQYLGTQYRWGGKTTFGIDCSGLCFMAYWLNGVAIFRDARIEPGFPIKKISPAVARKGDLLFFPGHVGMVIDDNTMIHSSEANNGVKIEEITEEWQARIVAAGSYRY